MKNRWESIILGKEYVLEPSHFVFRCVNARVEERHNCWRKMVHDSFGENLPNIWKHMMERDRFISMAKSQDPPLVGLYEIVNINHVGVPVVVVIIDFNPVNVSCSVDLMCAERGFSKRRPVLSGRLINQCAAIIDNIFQELAPIHASTMVFQSYRSLGQLIRRFSCRRAGWLPDHILIGSNNWATRKGVVIWDKFYK